MTDTKNIEGLADVMRRLKAMPVEVRTKALPRAASAGAAIFRDEAKRRAPVDQPPFHHDKKHGDHKPGTLRDSIRVRKNRKMKPGIDLSYSVATGKEAYWADWVEFGHDIVYHHQVIGWVPPIPFMRTAFETNKKRVVDGFVNELKKITDNVGKL